MGLKLYVDKADGTPQDITAYAPIFDVNEPNVRMGGRWSDGDPGTGEFVLLDKTGLHFNGVFDLPGHGRITLVDDASGCEIMLHHGRRAGVDAGRGVRRGGAENEWQVTSADANVELGGETFLQDWVRPDENDTDRLYALQAYILNGASSTAAGGGGGSWFPRASTNVVIDPDHLAPDTNTVSMPGKTYPKGTSAREVVQDCAETAGKNYGVITHMGPRPGTGDTMSWSAIPTGSTDPPHWPFCGTLQKTVTVAGSSGTPAIEDVQAQTGSAGADTLSFTVPGGLTDSAIIVFYANNYSADAATSSVYYQPATAAAHENFTRIGSPIYLGSSADYDIDSKGIRLDAWYLLNPTPTSGAGTKIQAGTGTGTRRRAVAAYLLSGVDQSSPIAGGDSVVSSGTATISADAPATGLCLDAIAYRSKWDGTPDATADVGQTEDFGVAGGAGFGNMGVGLQGSHKDVGGGGECSHDCLQYIVPGDTVTNVSPVKISDERADWNPDDLAAPVFEPIWDGGKGLNIATDEMISALLSTYGTGASTFQEDTAASAQDDYWQDTFSDSDSVNATQAAVRAAALVQSRKYGHVTNKCSILMRAEQLPLLGAGSLVGFKSGAVTGGTYLGDYVNRRIAECIFEPVSPELGRRLTGSLTRLFWAHLDLDRPPRRVPVHKGRLKMAATSDAAGAKYDNTASGLTASNLQDAVDELVTDLRYSTLNVVIDGGGSVISTGIKADVVVDFDCEIVQAELLADQSGSVVVNVWRRDYANYPPTVTQKITASAPPTISGATKSRDTTLTGWTTALLAGDELRFNVDSCSTIQRVTLALKLKRI